MHSKLTSVVLQYQSSISHLSFWSLTMRLNSEGTIFLPKNKEQRLRKLFSRGFWINQVLIPGSKIYWHDLKYLILNFAFEGVYVTLKDDLCTLLKICKNWFHVEIEKTPRYDLDEFFTCMRLSQSVIYLFLQASSASKFSTLRATPRFYTWKIRAVW